MASFVESYPDLMGKRRHIFFNCIMYGAIEGSGGKGKLKGHVGPRPQLIQYVAEAEEFRDVNAEVKEHSTSGMLRNGRW